MSNSMSQSRSRVAGSRQDHSVQSPSIGNASCFLTAEDVTLPRAPSIAIGVARRFPKSVSQPGSTLPLASLVESECGKIVSMKGTFSRVVRRTLDIGTKLCPEAYYTMPNVLVDADSRVAESRGVVVTEPRFRAELFAGHESPGPIFYPGFLLGPQGGSIGKANRFPAPPARAFRTEKTEGSADNSNATWQTHLKGTQARSRAATPGCKFGLRTATNSPWTAASSDIHTYDPVDERTRLLPGGVMPKAERRTQLGSGGESSEITPLPGHFHKPSNLGSGAFYVGVRRRETRSNTPGPGAYDLRLVDARMNRKRR